MKIDCFCDAPSNANTYLISNNEECIVIDPANNIKTLKRFINEKRLLGVFLTHGHYDHFKELNNLLNEYNVPIYMKEEAYHKLTNPTASYSIGFGINEPYIINKDNVRFIKEPTLSIGSFKVDIFFLPGHTNCSLAYKIENNLFSGDVIFGDSCGRWDLATGNYNALRESLNKIKKMEDNLMIYPGHDDSFCLLDAKMYNPYLK